MNKIDQLFVRACKSLTPEKRVLRTYQKYYFSGGTWEHSAHHISDILMNVYVQTKRPNLIGVVNAIQQDISYNGPIGEDDYWDRLSQILITKIRLTERLDFGEDHITPCRFRRD